MLVTLSGIVTLVRDLQSEKALSPIAETASLPMRGGISIAVLSPL